MLIPTPSYIDLKQFDFKWITFDPEVLSGKPIIRTTRISVAQVLCRLSHGMSINDIREMYGDFPGEAIPEVLAFAFHILEETRCR